LQANYKQDKQLLNQIGNDFTKEFYCDRGFRGEALRRRGDGGFDRLTNLFYGIACQNRNQGKAFPFKWANNRRFPIESEMTASSFYYLYFGIL
jgi:hypothetical protein